ncbi:PQQ-binding-like beta-propeller repeat protein [Pseudoalteromonas ruthenica]|uniref:PQQ-binding-like beta-propeller repeat protein n=2 Tax=Pseudoalteromonas TaxID=53246 RepID=UPI00110AE4FC|nr:PQQ-binding-like beta-propeller repeat protein [Pseudoalteromonas ruthenica]
MNVYYAGDLGHGLFKDRVNIEIVDDSLFYLEKGCLYIDSYMKDEKFIKYIPYEDYMIPAFELKSGLFFYNGGLKDFSRIDPVGIVYASKDYVLYSVLDGARETLIAVSEGVEYPLKGSFGGVTYYESSVYFQGLRKYSGFEKRDKYLNIIWRYELPRRESVAMPPFISDGRVIYVTPSSDYSDRRTTIRALKDSDGTEVWSQDYGFRFESCFVYNNFIVASSLEGVFFLDLKCGSIHRAIKVESDSYSHNLARTKNASAYIDGCSVFYINYLIGSLFVYNLSDLTLKKEISLPQGIHIKRFMGKDEASGLYYFYASQPRKEVGNTFLLELDPNNLDAPIEFEPTPDISSRFVAAEGTPEQCELHIDITTESLDDAIRFGEITVRKLAMQHSLSLLRSGPCLAEQGLKPDERFNGTIRLVLHDVQGDTAQIDEYLAILKQRVDEWAAGFDTLVGWFKNPDTGGYIRTQVFPRRAGQPEQVRILPKGNPFEKHELDDFVSDLESDTLKLDNKHYVARLTELTEAITSEQSSLQDMVTATYFKGTLAYINNDEQAALEHYFTAAQQGCFTGVLSYMDLGSIPQPGQPLFTLVAAYNLIGQDAWSAQEDIDASIKRLTDSERHELDKAAQTIVDDWQRNEVKSFNLV